MKPVMYIFANRDLGMSPGKLAAQVAHAAVEAYRISTSSPCPDADLQKSLVDGWYNQGHPKLVMLAEDTEQLLAIERYLTDRGYRTVMITDEGRTEVRPYTHTAFGVELVDKDDPNVQITFGSFRTYREAKPAPVGDQSFWRSVRNRRSR